MDIQTVQEEMRLLFGQFIRSDWAEIVIPTITRADKQFIGCLIPIERYSIGTITKIAERFRRFGGAEVVQTTKPFGNKNRNCLSITLHLKMHYSKNDLDLLADGLRELIKTHFGLPCFFIPYLNAKDACVRLGI